MSNRSICLIDWTPDGLDPGAMAIKGYSAFSRSLSLLKPRHQTIWCQNRTLVVGSYLSDEIQSVYSTAPAEWARPYRVTVREAKNSNIYLYMCKCVCWLVVLYTILTHVSYLMTNQQIYIYIYIYNLETNSLKVTLWNEPELSCLTQLNGFKDCYLIFIIQFHINYLLSHCEMVSSRVHD